MKSNKVFAKFAEEQQAKSNTEKNPKWINITLSIAFLGTLIFGSYNIYHYIVTPDPWYIQLISKACNLWIW